MYTVTRWGALYRVVIWPFIASLRYSHQGSDSSSTGEDSMVVIVDSFRGKGVVVKVAKRPGMEGKRLLHDDKEEEGEGEGAELPEEEEEPEEEEAEGIWKSLTG